MIAGRGMWTALPITRTSEREEKMATTTESETLTVTVSGMTCGSCKRHVEHALAAVPGVSAAEVDLAGGTATVTFDPAAAPPERLLEAVREEGYGAELAAPARAGLPLAARGCACCAS